MPAAEMLGEYLDTHSWIVAIFLVVFFFGFCVVFSWSELRLLWPRWKVWRECKRVLELTEGHHRTPCHFTTGFCDDQAQHVMAALLLGLIDGPWVRSVPFFDLHKQVDELAYFDVGFEVVAGALAYAVSQGLITGIQGEETRYQLNLPLKQVTDEKELSLEILGTLRAYPRESVEQEE